MANTDNPNGFRFMRDLGGRSGSPVVERIQIDTDQTVAKGDALEIGTDGYGEIWSSTDAQVLGVALEAAAGDTDTRPWVSYIPALPEYVFSGQCSGTPSQTKINEAVQIEGSTGAMEINEDAVADSDQGAQVRILGLSKLQGNTMGQYARLDFVFIGSHGGAFKNTAPGFEA